MILILRSLVLGLVIASIASADPLPQMRSIASVPTGAPVVGAEESAAEDALISEIDRQADLSFRDFLATTDSRLPLSVLKKAEREAVYRLKQMHVLTDILKASGPSTATAIIATEVLTTFVLAPIATAFGKHALTGVLLAVPWGMIAGAGVFSYQALKQRYKVSRALGAGSLRKLDALKRLVVGYDLKFRVSTIVLQSVEDVLSESTEFEVLRRSWNYQESKTPGVTVKELVEIVRKTANGPSYLETIYQEKLDPVFYSSLLLRYINSDVEPMTELMTLVRLRSPIELASRDAASLRRHLVGIDDVRTQVDRAVRNAQAQKAALKKRVKSGELTKDQGSEMKTSFAKEIARLQTVRASLLHHEYGTLLEARRAIEAGMNHRDFRVASDRSADLVKLALLAHVTPPAVPSAKAPFVALTCQSLFSF